jgi:hypothetical protein
VRAGPRPADLGVQNLASRFREDLCLVAGDVIEADQHDPVDITILRGLVHISGATI